MSKTNLLMAAIGGLLLISGCQSYKDGKSRTVGEFTDDSAIQFRVKSRLVRAPDVNGAMMNIEVKKGVVTLKGRVNSPEMKQKAVEIVESIKGVAAVDDRLRVKEKG